MAFDVGNGLSMMGSAVSKTAGDYLLANQKSELEDQSMRLADQLASNRQVQQQGFQTDFEKNVKQPFEAKQTTDTLASHERMTHETAGATLGAASLTSAAHKYAADQELAGKKYQADTYSSSREAVADANRQGRADVENIRGQNKKDLQASSGLSPDSIDLAAEAYLRSGEMPNLGFGGVTDKRAVMNAAADKLKAQGLSPTDWVANKALYKADASALAKMQGQSTMIESFAKTASKNADLALSLMNKGAGPTGSPILDKYVQAGRQAVQGDADVTGYHIALETFKTEAAKILSGSTSAQGITDAARAHVDSFFDKASNPDQVRAGITVLKQEMANRLSSFTDQRDAVLGRMGGTRPPGGVGAPAPGAEERGRVPAAGQQGQDNTPRAMPKPTIVDGKTYFNPSDFQPNIPYQTPQGTGFWHPDPKNPNGGTFMRTP